MSFRPFLYNAAFAWPRMPGWCALQLPLFLSVSVFSSLVVYCWRGGLLAASVFYILPHLVMDAWAAYYFLNLQKEGPRRRRSAALSRRDAAAKRQKG